jgi:hypothetical protein
MAEIPVERKGGIPWWAWALLALLAAVLLIWLFNQNDDPEVAVLGAPTAQVAAIGPVTTIAAAMTAEPGREVALQDVQVQRVVGDRGFLVGSNDGEAMFVVLDQSPTPGTPTEGRYDVTAGQTIDVNGVMRSTDDVPGRIEGLPPNTRTVIYAQSLNIDT